MPFVCECSQLGCNDVVELTLREYDEVRAHSRRFFVLRGHEGPAEQVVDSRAHFLIVAKVGKAGEIAERTDPRNPSSCRLLRLHVPYLGLERAALPETAGEVRRRITEFAAAHGAGLRLQADIALAVTEAVTNVIVHAYPAGRVGTLMIAADIEEDELEIVVTDEGEGFRPGTSPGLVPGCRSSPRPRTTSPSASMRRAVSSCGCASTCGRLPASVSIETRGVFGAPDPAAHLIAEAKRRALGW